MSNEKQRRVPPKRRSKKRKTQKDVAELTQKLGGWEPYQIDGCNVRLYRYTGEQHAPTDIDDPKQGRVPKLKPYAFDSGQLREMAWAIWPHDGGDPSPCLLTGPKGCGKTSAVLQLAARCNQRVYRTNLTIGTNVRHLKGKRGARDGGTIFYPGVLTRALEEGAWLLLDEVSGATPNVAMCLFPALEPDGEVWLEEAEPPRYAVRHPDFRVFMSDNVIGTHMEDMRFQYSGTNPDTNVALLDRIDSTIPCDYPDIQREHEIMRLNMPHLTDAHNDHIQFILRMVKDIRADDKCPGFSIRMSQAWVRRFTAGLMDADGKVYPLDLDQVLEAAAYAFLNKMRSNADRQVMEEIIRRKLAHVQKAAAGP